MLKSGRLIAHYRNEVAINQGGIMAKICKSLLLAMALYGCSALNNSSNNSREISANPWGEARDQVEKIMAKTTDLNQLKVQAAKY